MRSVSWIIMRQDSYFDNITGIISSLSNTSWDCYGQSSPPTQSPIQLLFIERMIFQGCFKWCIDWRLPSNFTLKGLFTIFLFSVRSHILNSNGVWYWWFCPEGPINAPNSRFWGFYFVPRDLDSQRHMGPWLAAQGTLTKSTIPHPITIQNMRSDRK